MITITRIVTLAVLIAGTAPEWVNADAVADVGTLSVRAPVLVSEFAIVPPRDALSVRRGWQYVLRYMHSEPSEGRAFSLLAVGTSSPDVYTLALYDGGKRSITFREFDEMEESEKLKVATVRKPIDRELAQALYEAWVFALLRARYGEAGLGSTGSRSFYLSTYSLETGHMCAGAGQYRKGDTTGYIVEIGLLARDYLDAKDAKKEAELRREIIERCAAKPKASGP